MWGSYNVFGKVNHKKSEFGLSYYMGPRDFYGMYRDNEETFRLADGNTTQRVEKRGSLRAHPEWIKNAHEKGMTVNVWTVNSPQEMLDFMAMGVDLITTDYPDQLKEIIAKFTE